MPPVQAKPLSIHPKSIKNLGSCHRLGRNYSKRTVVREDDFPRLETPCEEDSHDDDNYRNPSKPNGIGSITSFSPHKHCLGALTHLLGFPVSGLCPNRIWTQRLFLGDPVVLKLRNQPTLYEIPACDDQSYNPAHLELDGVPSHPIERQFQPRGIDDHETSARLHK
jgi:hypothetical protein